MGRFREYRGDGEFCWWSPICSANTAIVQRCVWREGRANTAARHQLNTCPCSHPRPGDRSRSDQELTEQPSSPLRGAAGAGPALLLAQAPEQREGREKRCKSGSSVGHILHGLLLLLLCSHGLTGPKPGPWRCAEGNRERFKAGSQAETAAGLGDNSSRHRGDAEFAAAAGNPSGVRAEGQGRIPALDHHSEVSPAAQLSAQIPPRGNELPAAPSLGGMPRSRAQPKHQETSVWMARAALRTSTALQRGGPHPGSPWDRQPTPQRPPGPFPVWLFAAMTTKKGRGEGRERGQLSSCTFASRC